MKPNIDEITSVEDLSKSDFAKNYFNTRPVIIRGGAKGTTAFKKWTPEYFESVFGTKKVEVRHSKSGVFNYHKGEVSSLVLPFNEAVTYLSLNNAYYIQQASIVKLFPELLAEIDEPVWMGTRDINRQTNLWFGGAGCVSPLHYDGFHNFLIQIVGRKELTLFRPEDIKFLYPNTSGPKNLSQISLIDLDNPDLNAFPLLKEARPFKIVLNPGDVLYMPVNWWHHVRSLDLSISINHWWSRLNLGYVKSAIKYIASGSAKKS